MIIERNTIVLIMNNIGIKIQNAILEEIIAIMVTKIPGMARQEYKSNIY